MSTNDAAKRLRGRLQQKVGAFMRRHELWPGGGPLVVAVSGGPDSMALLLILAQLARRRNVTLHVAHFDHGLRGDAVSVAESAFVAAAAESMALPFSAGAGDVTGRARRDHLSLEDAARRERYAFLSGVAAATGATRVATGHTASDQAETVLLNLVRGSGLDGLAAMSPDGAWPLSGSAGLRLVRPLLCLTRDETLAYCAAAGAEPLQDESNASADFRRNRVRRELLPLLRDLNPRIDEALVRLADAVRDDASYLDEMAQGAVVHDDGASLSRAWFATAPASLRARAVRVALESVAGDRQGFSARNVADVETLARDGRTGDRIDLPRGVQVVLGWDAIEFRCHSEASRLPDGEVCLPVPGEACFGDLLVAAGESPIAEDTAHVRVDAAAVGGGLVVRRRMAGDRFQPSGMPREKKLQDFFVDAHVSRDRRDALPLFVSPRGIVWIGGLRIADWARPREDRETVMLSYRSASRSS